MIRVARVVGTTRLTSSDEVVDGRWALDDVKKEVCRRFQYETLHRGQGP